LSPWRWLQRRIDPLDGTDGSAEDSPSDGTASENGLRTFCGLNENDSQNEQAPDRCTPAIPGPLGVHLSEQLSHFAKPLQRALTAVEKHRRTPSVRIPEPRPVVRPNTKLRSEQLKALVAAYESGVSIRKLGRQYRAHEQTIRAHLERAGVEIRPLRMADADLVAEIVRLYESGSSLRQISKQSGVTYGSVRNYLLRAGVELRPAVRLKGQPALRSSS
jgi:lambda repressor-like predicted transcriptional regulator